MAAPKVFDIAPSAPQKPLVAPRANLLSPTKPAPTPQSTAQAPDGDIVTVRRETIIKPPVEVNDIAAPVPDNVESRYKVAAETAELPKEPSPPQPLEPEQATAAEEIAEPEPTPEVTEPERSASGTVLAPIETRTSIIEDHEKAAQNMQTPTVFDTTEYILPVSHHKHDNPKKSIKHFLIGFFIIVLLAAAVLAVDAEVIDIGVDLPFDIM